MEEFFSVLIFIFSLSACADLPGGALFLSLVASSDDSADQNEVFEFVCENEEELLKAIENGNFSAYENKGFIKEIDNIIISASTKYPIK